MTMQTGWAEKASGTNEEITATKAALAGKEHVVFGVSASFASTTSGILLQIKNGATVIWEDYVYDAGSITFLHGLTMTRGAACSAVLAASGGAVQKVNMHGITR